MDEFPFQLLIKRRFVKERTESLTCTALLRIIPDRRQVYEAFWNGRDVIVKVFSHKMRAKHHLEREWRALSTLQARAISSPAPLFYGETENGSWAVVTERITDSSTVLDAFNSTTDMAGKLNLLALVCKELAKQHEKGMTQGDLHLDNFLLKAGKIFTVDPTEMRFSSGEIGKNKSLSQLALLTASLPSADAKSITKLYEEYARARKWSPDESDIALVERRRAAYRRRAIRKALRKSLRTGKRNLRVRFGRCRVLFDRGFCEGAEPIDFIKQIDALMDAGEVLKDGNTCYVSRLIWNGKDVVVKRYNHKGFIHSLRHTVKRSRAHRGWVHGHLLRMLNINTPAPLAYIEQRKGLLIWQSYLVTEYVQGQNLDAFLNDDKVPRQARSKMIEQIEGLFAEMAKHHISHRDLKHSNILITENGPTLIDLDAVKAHRYIWSLKIKKVMISR